MKDMNSLLVVFQILVGFRVVVASFRACVFGVWGSWELCDNYSQIMMWMHKDFNVDVN